MNTNDLLNQPEETKIPVTEAEKVARNMKYDDDGFRIENNFSTQSISTLGNINEEVLKM